MLSPFFLTLDSPKNAHAVFSLDDPKAKQVQYAGDVTGWNGPKKMTKNGTTWTISFDVPGASRLEYKFIVDGSWINDPKNPKKIDNGVGGMNSVWEGPDYRASTRFDRMPKHPMKRSAIFVSDGKTPIYSSQLSGREVTVFAPQHSKGLPLLVYGDGPSYEKYVHIQNLVENLVEAGKIRPVVVVLVPPIDRMKEYGKDWKEYGHFLFDSVLPGVRKLTGASAKAKDVVIGGASMGGLISLRLAEEFPNQIAGGVLSQSGAFLKDVGGDTAITPTAIKRMPKGEKLWMDWGSFEGPLGESNVKAASTLESMKRPFGSKITPEGHTWTAWHNRIAQGLVYLLGK